MATQTQAGPGRPLAFDPQQALQVALELFWQQGYEATSTAQLMAAMGISKSSLYQTFGSKHDLYNACLEQYGELTANYMRSALSQAASPKQFVLDLITGTAAQAGAADMPSGCFIVNTACELGAHHEFSGALLLKRRDKAYRIILDAVKAMQQCGEIGKKRQCDALARQIFACICGMKVMDKMAFSAQEQNCCVEMVHALLEYE
ncbi:TetR/AcrR family transcriptional regulator [Marinagarivorans cellulosilyticus]|uniref:TetR/AcrR family transcriptional regulator, transcriptional repressor for nem operon n=1 Tax=Marinagarivorans cellulosilyticus TaxID=2721545 RepID=A0AAN1WE28_9GAMM|nr:TetR/AcrR family transcriptional regulator [Marinagarivorans cellulosilyticus]BCD95905.1 TetR/AcrR family transcriptional regulator, transcriptional repressor for nem operon [Marinagarivorans cellulosilyticus]